MSSVIRANKRFASKRRDDHSISLGLYLATIRVDKEINAVVFAKKINMTSSDLSAIQNGMGSFDHLTLEKIKDALQMTQWEFDELCRLNKLQK